MYTYFGVDKHMHVVLVYVCGMQAALFALQTQGSEQQFAITRRNPACRYRREQT